MKNNDYSRELLSLLAQLVWEEIRKQSVVGNGIHLNFSVHLAGELCIDGWICRNNKVFAIAKELHPDWPYFTSREIRKEVKKSVKRIIGICQNTLKLTDEELIKYKII